MRPWEQLEAIAAIPDDGEARVALARFAKTLTPTGEAWRLLPGWVPRMVGLR